MMGTERGPHVRGLHLTGEITPPWEDQQSQAQVPLPRAQQLGRSSISTPRQSLPFLSVYDEHRKSENDTESRSRHSTISGPDEEADVFKMNRMLKDSAGRLRMLVFP